MKKIYLKSDEPRKELYRIVLKEFSKQGYEQALIEIDRETRFWKKYRDLTMKLYSIHYKGDENNPKNFEGITNNFEEWLEEHNSCREEDCKDDADDFEVEEISLFLYKDNK